ncbi:MAG: GNAT family N-acetyltransferase [Phenylobacterium sp.]|uniref:GNAT family N-acetyltransferase n=1 Tax=Phenylobacterium sp. TaxID=1871053 RepID=UPI002734F7F4|nr:GNAT family N-acetyltransferase [Phenylobacterium sp.]MDP3746284.1 GNAT family N-acetyltransferase [Phenylobacterium sp.]
MTEAEIIALRRGSETPVRARAADLQGVAEDLSAAFATDPMFDWFMRDDAKRDAARLRLFKRLVGMALADGEVLQPASGGAASIWLPSESLGPSSLLEELRVMPTVLAATGFSRLSRMSAMRAAMDKHHPMERPHVYLWFVGVRPEAQGLGVGSRLIAAGLERVDALGLPAYLESSSPANVPLYRRHGFEVTREIQPRPDSPIMWAMWREPR